MLLYCCAVLLLCCAVLCCAVLCKLCELGQKFAAARLSPAR
ncbi:hypothetical protein SGL43_00013 [Streptomyces globisporus]|uniref:Uncharacterized protein n=1 Tax=Streptomyces globisporus TaxID=1908 RepID=A0ABN8US48_STRGL|nr:hypothetical protein SGL43_00013 [Streptomyces globisporus]